MTRIATIARNIALIKSRVPIALQAQLGARIVAKARWPEPPPFGRARVRPDGMTGKQYRRWQKAERRKMRQEGAR